MSSFHYFAGDRLSAAELSAACIDGDLLGVGDGYMPADAAETTWMRARSLAPVLGHTLAATHATAAWVHGALGDLPGHLDVQRCSDRRRHHVPHPRLIYRDMRLDPLDRLSIAGVVVTTLPRTVADLARGGDEYDAALCALLAWNPDARAAGLRWIDQHPGLPRSRRARERLAMS